MTVLKYYFKLCLKGSQNLRSGRKWNDLWPYRFIKHFKNDDLSRERKSRSRWALVVNYDTFTHTKNPEELAISKDTIIQKSIV